MLKHIALVAAVVAALVWSTTSPAGYRGNPSPFAGPPKPSPQFVIPLPTPDEAADLTFMREEEKLARDVYLRMHEMWGIAPFAGIAGAEQFHMDAVLRLLTRYQLPDPTTGRLIGEFADAQLQALFDALIARGSQGAVAALGVGALIEEIDLDDLAEAIARSSKADIDQVYEALACGSRNHLRAFAGALESITGQSYVAQFLPKATVEAILDSPIGDCSASTRSRGTSR